MLGCWPRSPRVLNPPPPPSVPGSTVHEKIHRAEWYNGACVTRITNTLTFLSVAFVLSSPSPLPPTGKFGWIFRNVPRVFFISPRMSLLSLEHWWWRKELQGFIYRGSSFAPHRDTYYFLTYIIFVMNCKKGVEDKEQIEWLDVEEIQERLLDILLIQICSISIRSCASLGTRVLSATRGAQHTECSRVSQFQGLHLGRITGQKA